MAENFLTYQHNQWGKISLVSTPLLVLSYLIYRSQIPPSGGTVMGLVYGVLSFTAILVLMSYGIRKRTYQTAARSVQAWLSSHVYLGVLSWLLIPLHSGFHFAADIHTLAFVLLTVVVLSGLLGAYLYLTVPHQFSQCGPEIITTGPDGVDTEYHRIVQQMRTLSEGKSPALSRICQEEIQRGQPKRFAGWRLLVQRQLPSSATSTLQEFQSYLGQVPPTEREELQQLAALATRKRELTQRVQSQMRLKNLLEVWLFVHLPVSIMMLITVMIHIFTVLYY